MNLKTTLTFMKSYLLFCECKDTPNFITSKHFRKKNHNYLQKNAFFL